jgi:hypothetical protein
VKVEILMEWSCCFPGINNKIQLPSLFQVPDFLDFVAVVLNKNGSTTTNWILQEQYDIDDNLKDQFVFFRFFRLFLQTGLAPWLLRLVEDIPDSGMWDTTDDMFMEVNR